MIKTIPTSKFFQAVVVASKCSSLAIGSSNIFNNRSILKEKQERKQFCKTWPSKHQKRKTFSKFPSKWQQVKNRNKLSR